MNRWVGLGLVLITFGALGLRVPQLGLRPMHNDEAVNAIKIRDLWLHGRYTYDPDEHHGPTLYYATLPFVSFSGAQNFAQLTEGNLRAVAVFFGLILILSLWLLADGLGPGATLVAGLLTAISPAMVFYSRYFIHEILLVSFTLLVIGGGWRYSRTPTGFWAAFTGAGVGFMYATKETFVIQTSALMGALLATFFWESKRQLPPESRRFTLPPVCKVHAAVALGAAVFVSLLLFTSFFQNARGPLDSLRTYVPWLKRAGGASPHIHPWFFYLHRLLAFQERKGPFWSEGFIVFLACIGGVSALRKSAMTREAALAVFLTFYSLLLTTAYSLISYKTPWCLLGFLHGFILLAGVGAVVLVRTVRTRPLQILVMAVLAAGAVQLGWQSWRASYTFAADRRNPYVYAQTAPDVSELVKKVKDLALVHPDGDRMVIKVMAADSDYWPLPWYLRGFERVGWWDHLPPDPYAPITIAGTKLGAALDDKSDKHWLMTGYFELRPKTFLELYVQFELWQKYIEALPRDRP